MADKQSVVLLSGTVHRPIRRQSQTTRLSLRSRNSLFYVRVRSEVLAQQSQSLAVDDPVTIVGYLSSFFNRDCGRHHALVNAQTITPVAVEPLVGGLPLLLSCLYEGMAQTLEPYPDGEARETTALITGRISSLMQASEGRTMFSLRNGDGVFYVNMDAELSAAYDLSKWLKPGDALTFLGCLKSFVYDRCDSHHSWLQPLLLIPRSSVWETLWDAVGASVSVSLHYNQILKRNREA